MLFASGDRVKALIGKDPEVGPEIAEFVLDLRRKAFAGYATGGGFAFAMRSLPGYFGMPFGSLPVNLLLTFFHGAIGVCCSLSKYINALPESQRDKLLAEVNNFVEETMSGIDVDKFFDDSIAE